MPRKKPPWTLTVEGYDRLQADRLYLLRIINVNEAADGIAVTLEHVDAEQTGRMYAFTLPVPIRPEGITAQFFRACWFDTNIGSTITPKDVVNRLIQARFTYTTGGEIVIAAFEAFIHKENSDDTVSQHGS